MTGEYCTYKNAFQTNTNNVISVWGSYVNIALKLQTQSWLCSI